MTGQPPPDLTDREMGSAVLGALLGAVLVLVLGYLLLVASGRTERSSLPENTRPMVLMPIPLG